MTRPNSMQCKLCGQKSYLISDSVPAYQEGKIFAIYECEGCRVSFAYPLETEDLIYKLIYHNIELVPGYNRYHYYAYEVLKQKRPLDYLCRQEESYWAVVQHLRKRRRLEENTLHILEVGCGMGYFTYALNQDGFNVKGVDISSEALIWAHENYNSYFSNSTLQDLKIQDIRYDVIIMNQLLEHISDVHGFIADALSLLAPKGELLITTPNKSAYSDSGVDWETELPPVHLWWFSEDSMRFIAGRHNCTITFIAFEQFYDSFYRKKMPITPLQSRKSILSAQGDLLLKQPIPDVRPVRKLLECMGFISLLRKVRTIFDANDKWCGPQGPICAAVLRYKGGTH